MKKYILYRIGPSVGLLIGLFSLHVLSACVNTRNFINHFGNQVSISTAYMHNGSSFTASAPLRSTDPYINTMPGTNTTQLSNMTVEQIALITEAIQKDPGQLVTDSSSKEAFSVHTTQPEPEDLFADSTTQAHFIGNTAQKGLDWVTDKKPSDSITLKDPMILDEQVLEDIRNSDFSIERIKYWLDQGLNINAQHKATGWGLIIYGLQYNKEDLVRYLLTQGANVNIQDVYGFTPLMIALLTVNDTHMNEDMVHLLIQYNADPCIENKYGGSAASLAKAVDKLYGSCFGEIFNRLKQCSPQRRSNGGLLSQRDPL